MSVEIKILPAGKAYGYDRDTLKKEDKQKYDWRRADDLAAARRAARTPDENVRSFDPRDEE